MKRIMLMADTAMAVDGLRFLAAEKADGFDDALAMDAETWKRYTRLSVERTRRHFPLDNPRLRGAEVRCRVSRRGSFVVAHGDSLGCALRPL